MYLSLSIIIAGSCLGSLPKLKVTSYETFEIKRSVHTPQCQPLLLKTFLGWWTKRIPCIRRYLQNPEQMRTMNQLVGKGNIWGGGRIRRAFSHIRLFVTATTNERTRQTSHFLRDTRTRIVLLLLLRFNSIFCSRLGDHDVHNNVGRGCLR